jgi:hypothetical protein
MDRETQQDVVTELSGPIHGRIATLRGLCSDEAPHTEIDRALAELDERVMGLRDRVAEEPDAPAPS